MLDKDMLGHISETTGILSLDASTIEKWVGLTRRTIAIERGYHHDDRSLIRHVYDLNALGLFLFRCLT